MLDYEDQYEDEAEYPGSSEHEAAEDEDEMYSLKVQLVGTSGEQRATLLETWTDTATVIMLVLLKNICNYKNISYYFF